jgi:hypothetical protein
MYDAIYDHPLANESFIRFAFASAFGLVFVGKRGLPLYPHLVVFNLLPLCLLSLDFDISTEDLQETG